MKKSVSIFLVFLSLTGSVFSQEMYKSVEVIKTVPTQANQGVAVDAEYYYEIYNTAVKKFSKKTGQEIASWKAGMDKEKSNHFSHMNSGQIYQNKLYIAHSNKKLNLNTLEIWDVSDSKLVHLNSLKLKATIKSHGCLTWADRHPDGSWWVCYAIYGKELNKGTKLFKCEFDGKDFKELKEWRFPKEVTEKWGWWGSCSGGSWGPDGLLYTTGHDNHEAYVLNVDKSGELKYLKNVKGVGFYGQGITWDRSSKEAILWGIRKRKNITLTKFN
jgi:hypothetical protein